MRFPCGHGQSERMPKCAHPAELQEIGNRLRLSRRSYGGAASASIEGHGEGESAAKVTGIGGCQRVRLAWREAMPVSSNPKYLNTY